MEEVGLEFNIGAATVSRILHKYGAEIWDNGKKPVVAFSVAGVSEGNFAPPEPRNFPSISEAAQAMFEEGKAETKRAALCIIGGWLNGRSESVNHLYGYRWYLKDEANLHGEWLEWKQRQWANRRKVLVADQAGTRRMFPSCEDAARFILNVWHEGGDSADLNKEISEIRTVLSNPGRKEKVYGFDCRYATEEDEGLPHDENFETAPEPWSVKSGKRKPVIECTQKQG